MKQNNKLKFIINYNNKLNLKTNFSSALRVVCDASYKMLKEYDVQNLSTSILSLYAKIKLLNFIFRAMSDTQDNIAL